MLSEFIYFNVVYGMVKKSSFFTSYLQLYVYASLQMPDYTKATTFYCLIKLS